MEPSSLGALAKRASLALAVLFLISPTALGAEPAPPRTLSVSGEGEVKAVPDEAMLSAGVISQAQTAQDALAANRQAMNAVFDTLKRQGIPDKDIQTSQFSVSPQIDRGKDGTAPPRVTGYEVSNSVSVKVDDLSKLGAAIDALVASGANSMGGIEFDIRDPKPLLREAREAAVKDAMERATIYAKAAGVSLGRVLDINEGGDQVARPMYRSMALMAPVAQSTPVAAGEQTVSANVTMSFEIK